MHTSPKTLRLYVAAVIVAGLSLLVYLSLPTVITGNVIWGFLFWGALVTAIEFIPIPMPRGGYLTLGFPVIFAALISVGPVVTSWAALCSTLVTEGFKRRRAVYIILFDTAQLVLTISLAWFVYYLSGGRLISALSIGRLVPLVLAVVVYFMVNSVLVQTYLALQQRISPMAMWLVNFKWAAPNYLAQAPLGYLMAVLYVQMSWWAVLFLTLPLFIAHYAYRLYVRMREEHMSTIQALAAAIEARDPYTEEHSKRLAQFAVAIARELGMPEDKLEALEYAAVLHDIGKLGVRDQVLHKPGSLTDEEWAEIWKHADKGADIIAPVDSYGDATEFIRYHHERYNGRGYPKKLKGEDIPLGARIIAVVDAYDAMVSGRPYRPAYPYDEAVSELKKNSGTQFDPRVVEAFLKVLERAENSKYKPEDAA